MNTQTRTVSQYFDRLDLLADNTDAVFAYRLALGSIAAVLSMLWLAMLPAWVETFMHLQAGVGIQMLILSSAAVIGIGAFACGRLAVRGVSLAGINMVRQGAAFARKRVDNPLGVAVRSLNLRQHRTPAPMACQRKSV